MTHLLGRLTGLLVLLIAIAAAAQAQERDVTTLTVQAEPTYRGKPLSHWLKSIQNRDLEMELAFDAIHALGPDASAAVPELTEIVAESFTPVQIGVDTRDLILSKLADILLRADAVDALAAIGEAAAPSSETLIQWALTLRVIPGNLAEAKDQESFIDLVAMDVLERMRVAGAVAEFGPGASPAIAQSLTSPDAEERKLAVAILNEKALPIAASLLKAKNCDERELGIAILTDMWPVVPKDHPIELKSALGCGRNIPTHYRHVYDRQ